MDGVMESLASRERFVIEVLLGLILVVFLVLLVFLVIGISNYKTIQTQTPTAITNLYNTNYNTYQQPKTYPTTQQGQVVQYTNSKTYDKNRYMHYNDNARLRKAEGIFGNEINNYEVYVRNEEFKGGYFEVTFYFEDYYGEISRSSETHYIPAREEKKIFYRDVSQQRYKYGDWWYEVKSLSKVPAKVYYTDRDRERNDNDVFYSRDEYYPGDGMRVYYFR